MYSAIHRKPHMSAVQPVSKMACDGFLPPNVRLANRSNSFAIQTCLEFLAWADVSQFYFVN
jgi:hypothetical protein